MARPRYSTTHFLNTPSTFLMDVSLPPTSSTTSTMAGSLQIAAQTIPNPTNTITNVYATGGGVGSINSAASAVKITAKAIHKCTNDVTGWVFTSARMDRDQIGHNNTHEDTTINRNAGGGKQGWRTRK
eukprot:scaffold133571_cov33-Cyclotella_meneghiniana.AAC.1